ncbi:uncharacterized protein EDB91DRAFT_1082555 [Suillus paluster]|uniref:uncharacterized protein n=1 Tax=Suillus paluster TaxID=48578 RepID=UPI001B866A22|nr:uncharacterized protein EDB91DRAFT_1082555 [Suillus paluster]KAG1738838.1 hypothetical protein EDB91DRAFT_1082555 [Suillus paluster]
MARSENICQLIIIFVDGAAVYPIRGIGAIGSLFYKPRASTVLSMWMDQGKGTRLHHVLEYHQDGAAMYEVTACYEARRKISWAYQVDQIHDVALKPLLRFADRRFLKEQLLTTNFCKRDTHDSPEKSDTMIMTVPPHPKSRVQMPIPPFLVCWSLDQGGSSIDSELEKVSQVEELEL